MSTQRPIKGFEALQQLAAEAADDSGLRERLKKEAPEVLKERGLTVPSGVTVQVIENTDNKIHLVLPTRVQPKDQLDVDETDVKTLSTAMHF